MKEWYMECPFCANEVKKWAKKCQYCKEFLNEDIKTNPLKAKNKKIYYFIFIPVIIVFSFIMIYFFYNNGKVDSNNNFLESDETIQLDDDIQLNFETENLFSKESECASLFMQLESYEKRNEYDVVQNGWRYYLNTRVEDTFYSSLYDTCMYSVWVSEGQVRTDWQWIELRPVNLFIKNSFSHSEIWNISWTNYYNIKPILMEKISSLK